MGMAWGLRWGVRIAFAMIGFVAALLLLAVAGAFFFEQYRPEPKRQGVAGYERSAVSQWRDL